MPATWKPVDWYRAPLYYDVAFESLTAREAAFLEAVYDRFAPSGRRRVLEPACGSGRLVEALARRGYRVSAFDLVPEMVEFSRRRLARAGLDARLWVDAMQHFRCRARFDLAHCLVSTFKHLLTEEDARAHLAAVARVLAPGGVYALGFHLTDYVGDRGDRERWTGRRGALEVTCNISSWAPERRRRVERMRSRLVVRDGRGPAQRFETSWLFRTYSARQFRNLLARVPELEHVATYDFEYDIDQPVELGDGQTDHVVILQRV